jgi:hypothetical protein
MVHATPRLPSLPDLPLWRMLNRTNYTNRNENPNESDLSMSIPFTTYPAYAGAMRQRLAEWLSKRTGNTVGTVRHGRIR